MSDIVFISDLHLMPERPDTIALFIQFIEDIASKADQLYILGDFLEVWWGDDDPAAGYQEMFKRLNTLARIDKTEIFLMHGNRDFLIGETLATQCHFKIIYEPLKINIQGRDILLMHGDTLCTDDTEYQTFRTMVRDSSWQQQFLSKSLEERFQIAKMMREKSKQSTAAKSEYIMDVNQKATNKTFTENGVDLIIHGHTHRPAIHKENISDKETTRVVLGDWHENGSYLRINHSIENLELQVYP